MKHSRTSRADASAGNVRPVPEARQARKRAGDWLKKRRLDAGLSQVDLAAILGLKYYTFVSQVENGFSRVPTEMMEAWAKALQIAPTTFVRELLVHYEPELNRLLFGAET